MARKEPKPAMIFSGDNVIEFPQTRYTGSVNRHELTSIKALTTYVAHNQNVPEQIVRSYLNAEFHIDDIAGLHRDDYERAIRFLVDLQIDLTIN